MNSAIILLPLAEATHNHEVDEFLRKERMAGRRTMDIIVNIILVCEKLVLARDSEWQ